jgi:hypothetical protein
MCNPKVKLLNKAVKKPTVDDPNEKISINKAFKCQDIKLSVAPTKTKEEKKQVIE